jgi:hypothetical protein
LIHDAVDRSPSDLHQACRGLQKAEQILRRGDTGDTRGGRIVDEQVSVFTPETGSENSTVMLLSERTVDPAPGVSAATLGVVLSTSV